MLSDRPSDRDLCFDIPTFLEELVSDLRCVSRRNIDKEKLLLLVAINPG